MPGYAICWGPCFGCKRLFGFNPLRVPSIVVHGERVPICRACVERANSLRKHMGEPLFPEPHPDAYEPIPEEELP